MFKSINKNTALILFTYFIGEGDRMDQTLISTIYSIEPVMFCITHFNPKKVVLLMDEDTPKEQLDIERMLKETIGTVLDIETVKTSLYDVYSVAKDTVDTIEEEKEHNRKVVVNISRGRKPQALGALFGCYARSDMVEQIVYVTEEKKEIIELPILNFGISQTKRTILEELEQTQVPLNDLEYNLSLKEETIPEETGQISVKKLSDKIGISRGMTYNHIRELREMGFIDLEKLEITTAGRLAII